MIEKLTKVKAADLFKLFEAFQPEGEFSDEDVYDFGMKHGYDVSPEVDPKAAALRKIKRAIKQSSVKDAQGRKVPKYIFVGDEDGQLSLFSELAFTPGPVVQRNINNHRNKGIQTLVAAQIIADSYNENYNLGAPVELDLFVADDVAEQVIMRRNSNDGTSDELGDEEDSDGPALV